LGKTKFLQTHQKTLRLEQSEIIWLFSRLNLANSHQKKSFAGVSWFLMCLEVRNKKGPF